MTPSPGENLTDGNPTRVFPDIAQVLAGNTNAATGTCPTATTPNNQQLPNQLLDCYSEFLPTVDYRGSLGQTAGVMTFRVTARDLYPNGGGLAFDDVNLTVDKTAGPLLVTSQATAGTTVAGGSAVPVTWAVNNTQGLAPSVKISLSTNGGASFARCSPHPRPTTARRRCRCPTSTPPTHGSRSKRWTSTSSTSTTRRSH